MKSPPKTSMACLKMQGGLYYWAGLPFTGVAFNHLADRELESFILENGQIVGKNYVPAYFDCPNGLPQIDITDYILDDTYGSGWYYVVHNGQPYTGLAFDCDPTCDGYCSSEFLFVDGVISYQSQTGYDGPLGILTSLDLEPNGFKKRTFFESYEWFLNESIKRIDVIHYGLKKNFCNLLFDELGAVRWFMPGKNFSEQQTAELFCWPFKDMLREIVFSTETVLAREAMNDDLLRLFMANDSFRQVKKVDFFKTNVSPELAKSLVRSQGIEVTVSV